MTYRSYIYKPENKVEILLKGPLLETGTLRRPFQSTLDYRLLFRETNTDYQESCMAKANIKFKIHVILGISPRTSNSEKKSEYHWDGNQVSEYVVIQVTRSQRHIRLCDYVRTLDERVVYVVFKSTEWNSVFL